MNEVKKVEMKITCNKCHRKFKTYIFTERLCPSCKLKREKILNPKESVGNKLFRKWFL